MLQLAKRFLIIFILSFFAGQACAASRLPASDDLIAAVFAKHVSKQHHKDVEIYCQSLIDTHGTLVWMNPAVYVCREYAFCCQKLGADPNAAIDAFGNTSLHWAIVHNARTMLCGLLWLQGIAINASNKRGNTPLHLAAISGNVSATRLLLQYEGIDICKENLAGKTAADCAMDASQPEIVALLEAHGKRCEDGEEDASFSSESSEE